MNYENRTVFFAFFCRERTILFGCVDYSVELGVKRSKLASKAMPFPAVVRQRLIVLSNVLHIVLGHELEEKVLVSRKTAKVDE